MSRWWWGAVCAVLLPAACAVWWPTAAPVADGAAPAPSAVVQAAPVNGGLPVQAPMPASLPGPVAARALPCAVAGMAIVGPGVDARACLDRPQVSQTGDVRTWRAASTPAGWQLQVDLNGDAVLAVELATPGGALARCAGEACSGAALGPRDAHGTRRLTLGAVALVSAAARWQIDAVLALPAAPPPAPCEDAEFAVTGADGAAWQFCASTSAAAQVAAGARVFHWRSFEGDALRVGLGAQGQVEEIVLGPWRCSGWGCSGAVLDPAADDSLVLRLEGVPLHATPAQAPGEVRLMGRLRLAAG